MPNSDENLRRMFELHQSLTTWNFFIRNVLQMRIIPILSGSCAARILMDSYYQFFKKV